MGAVYNRDGQAVAWMQDDVLYDSNGEIRGFVNRGVVYTPDSTYRGRLDRGIFRDTEGRAVAFMDGASDPVLPEVSTLPVVAPPPMPLGQPTVPEPPQAPNAPQPKQEWSHLSWSAYLSGER